MWRTGGVLALAMMCLIGTASASEWPAASQVFEARPAGYDLAGVIRSMDAPFLMLSDELIAVGFYNEALRQAYGCFANPKANGGDCFHNTIVNTSTSQGLSVLTQILPVTATSALFVVSSVTNSFVAYVEVRAGVLWRYDRRNCSGPVAYDPVNDVAIVSFGKSGNVNPYDSIEAFKVQDTNATSRLLWALPMDLVEPTGAHPSQFSAQFPIFGARVFFSYSKWFYSVDVASGPKAYNVIESPCSLTLKPLPLPTCPNCTIPYNVDLINPFGQTFSEELTSIVVSISDAKTQKFGLCGYRIASVDLNMTLRFNVSNAFDLTVNGKFVTTSAASASNGLRNHSAFFISGLSHGVNSSLEPLLLAVDVKTGTNLWVEQRGIENMDSMPCELLTSPIQGGADVIFGGKDRVVAKTIDLGIELWGTSDTACSAKPSYDPVSNRVFCQNDTYGIVALNPPPTTASNRATVAWSAPVETRGINKNSGTVIFQGLGGSLLVGAGLAKGRYAAWGMDPAPTPSPTGTTTPPPSTTPGPTKPGPPPPAPPPKHHGLSAGVTIVIIFICLVVVGVGAFFGFRVFRNRRAANRRGGIDSALSYGGGNGGGGGGDNESLQTAQHSSVAAHGPRSGYGSLYA